MLIIGANLTTGLDRDDRVRGRRRGQHSDPYCRNWARCPQCEGVALRQVIPCLYSSGSCRCSLGHVLVPPTYSDGQTQTTANRQRAGRRQAGRQTDKHMHHARVTPLPPSSSLSLPPPAATYVHLQASKKDKKGTKNKKAERAEKGKKESKVGCSPACHTTRLDL